MDSEAIRAGKVTPMAPAREPAPPSASVRRDNLLRAGLRILLVAMISLAVVRFVTFALDILTASYTGYDFSVYYAAALALRDNVHANIFDPRLLQAAAHAHGAATPAVIYTYPPLLAVLLLPLTLFPYHVALALWTTANLVIWLLCAVLFTAWLRRAFVSGAAQSTEESAATPQALDGSSAPARTLAPRLFTLALAVFLTLSYQPIEQTLVLGQVSLFILFLLVLAPWLVERDRPYLAGGVLALAIWIKLFPAVLIAYYLLRGRWRVVAGAFAGVLLLALAQIPVIGLDGVLATRHVVDNGAFQAAQFHNESLARVPLWIAAELGGHLSSALTLAGDALAALIGIVFLAGMLRLRRQTSGTRSRLASHPADANRELLGYTWALCTMVLVSPITWEHYDSWLLLAVIVCLGIALRGYSVGMHGALERNRYAASLLAAIIVAYAITMHHLPFGYDGTTTFDIGPYVGGRPLRPFFMLLRPLGALLLWLCSGGLFLRAFLASEAPVSRYPSRGDSIAEVPSPAPHLALSIQARMVGGLLLAVIATETLLAFVTTAFGPYGPH